MTLGIQIDFQGKIMTFRGPGYFFYLWNNCVKQEFGSLSGFILLVPESVFRLDMASILYHWKPFQASFYWFLKVFLGLIWPPSYIINMVGWTGGHLGPYSTLGMSLGE